MNLRNTTILILATISSVAFARTVQHTKNVNFKISYDIQNLTKYCPKYTCTDSAGNSASLDVTAAGVKGSSNMYIECIYMHEHY
jgi:hypothetical protein